MSEHYVNNRLFTAVMTEWVIEYKKCKEEGRETPRIPEYAGECFMKIAQGFARRPRWCGYTYIEDMKSEAVLTCIMYAHNFNPIYKNAFGYFTRYCQNSFLQFTNKERKLSDLKFEMVKINSASLGKMDYNDINLYDTETEELVNVDRAIEEIEESE